MKQYLDKEQTAKLIELGFPKPKYALPIRQEGQALIHALRYTIEELIEYLCPHFQTTNYKLTLQKVQELSWVVEVEDVNYNDLDYQVKEELIDALFCACVTLKEEEVI